MAPMRQRVPVPADDDMDLTEAHQTVSLLYRAILGREADAAGLQQKVDTLVAGTRSLQQVLADFLASDELHQVRRLQRPNLTSFPVFPDALVSIDRRQIDALFTKTAGYWRHTASRPEEIYWSVLTETNWNRALTPADRRAFVQTGASYCERILAQFQALTGRPVHDLRCLDFGCGVGRLAIHFAQRVGEVCAVDFSEAHLAELQENARLFGCADKISQWPLRLPADLHDVPPADLVYSLVALQHNTPPVIAFLLRSLLDHVRPGGLAFLHVTLAKAGYGGFTVAGYLEDPRAGTTMEVHFLPRANINDVAREAGCEIVSSQCIGGNDYAYSEEFVFRRRT